MGILKCTALFCMRTKTCVFQTAGSGRPLTVASSIPHNGGGGDLCVAKSRHAAQNMLIFTQRLAIVTLSSISHVKLSFCDKYLFRKLLCKFAVTRSVCVCLITVPGLLRSVTELKASDWLIICCLANEMPYK